MGDLSSFKPAPGIRHFSSRISRFISLNSTDVTYAKNQFPEQFLYGHREILLEYLDLDLSTQFIGNLQHGFYAIGNIDYRTPRFYMGRPTKFWAFSKDLETEARKKGFKNVHAIGAPWIYMKTSKSQGSTETTSSRFLIMPSHSQVDKVDVSTKMSKMKRAARYREIIGDNFGTVCLHPIDFLDSDTRESYMNQNFEVTCLGMSGLNPPWTFSANRVHSLYKLREIMNSHTHYLSDDLGTSFFYALDSGLKAGIFPKVLGNSKIQSIYDSQFSFDSHINWSKSFLRNYFSNCYNDFGGNSDNVNMARNYLGYESKMDKYDLLDVIDYRVGVYPELIRLARTYLNP
jgi:hypothetical protein